MKLSEDLAWRGLVKDKTFKDICWLDEPRSRSFYWGVDPSSDSLTIGNLAPLLLALRLAKSDWKAVLLIGGGTSLVGDPAGKKSERDEIERKRLMRNSGLISAQIARVFGEQPFTAVNNYDWWEGKEGEYDGVKYLDFLREWGKKFSMSELLQREFVTERMGDGGPGISYAEFSYGLVQGYDFYQLRKNSSDLELQIGGSDQWSNMLMGVTLIRKKDGGEVHAMSMPLVVNKQTGVKFGKSEVGAVWLDEAKTSSTDFHQFWLSSSDEDVEDYLKIFTLLDRTEIESIMAEHHKNTSKRVAQHALANAVTAIVHPHSVDKAKAAAESLAEGKPTKTVKLPPGTSLVDALVKSGLADSNSDARRIIGEGGVYLNDKPFSDDSLPGGNSLVLRRGKKLGNSVLIELE